MSFWKVDVAKVEPDRSVFKAYVGIRSIFDNLRRESVSFSARDFAVSICILRKERSCKDPE